MQLVFVENFNVCSLIYDNLIVLVFLFRLIILYSNSQAHREVWTSNPKRAVRYEVWKSIVQVQRWWRSIKGTYTQIDVKTIKNSHA